MELFLVQKPATVIARQTPPRTLHGGEGGHRVHGARYTEPFTGVLLESQTTNARGHQYQDKC